MKEFFYGLTLSIIKLVVIVGLVLGFEWNTMTRRSLAIYKYVDNKLSTVRSNDEVHRLRRR